MTELPKAYEKYDSDTQDALSGLLESIEHLVHIVNGVRADILNGNYHHRQAESDYENVVYSEGIDIFSALQEVSEAPWDDEDDMVDDDESDMIQT